MKTNYIASILHFDVVHGTCRAGRAMVTLAVLAWAGCLAVMPAAAYPEFVYKATAEGHPNITMNLTITDVNGKYDATGSIYLGNILFIVTGDLMGTTLTAGATINAPGVAVISTPVPVIGTLKGALGTGAIDVFTGYLDFNGAYYELAFDLAPVVASSPAPAPKPTPPPLPASVHMSGGTGFGYTTVTLTLNTRLNGSVYDVTGTIFVNQYFNCALVPNCTPHYVGTTLDLSAMLAPGVTGTIKVTGAPAGNNPQYSGTIGATGTTFTSFLSGFPTLGITGLYINAEQ